MLFRSQPSQMPFQTALMYKYDSGDFPARLDEALKRADHAGFEARRKEAAKRGRLRGLGISTYIEACSGAGPESTTLQIQPSGKIALLIGTVLPFMIGVSVAWVFGYRDAVSLTTIGAGAITYIVGPVTGAAIKASSDVMALSIATGVIKAILVMVTTPAEIGRAHV